MQVILNEDIKTLGYKGDVVKVKNGYFRNFLYPRNLAVAATPSLLKLAEKRKEKKTMEKQQLLDNAKEVLKKLRGLEVIVKAKVSEKGKLYGAISEKEVIDAIREVANIVLEPDYLKMEHFKELGEYDVIVNLGTDLEETVKVKVEEA